MQPFKPLEMFIEIPWKLDVDVEKKAFSRCGLRPRRCAEIKGIEDLSAAFSESLNLQPKLGSEKSKQQKQLYQIYE